MSETLREHKTITISAIQIGDRRPADPAKVQALKESIQAMGLLHAIGVTPDYQLIFGLHRMEACKLLEWEQIPVAIYDFDAVRAELAEIDENLMRSELCAIETGEALLRRKELVEQLNPEIKHGGDRKSEAAKSSGNNCHLIGFADDVAQKTGWSARTVRSYIAAAKRIPHDLRKSLRNTDVGSKITELTKLGTLPDEDQRAVVERIVDGAGSVADAIKNIDEPQRSPEMEMILATKQATTKNGPKPHAAGRPEEVPSEVDSDIDGSTAPANVRDTPLDAGEGGAEFVEAEADDPIVDEDYDTMDPVTLYHNLLEDLPRIIEVLSENLDEIVGNGLAPSEAARVLQEAVDFFDVAREAELNLAGQSVELDLVPCGA